MSRISGLRRAFMLALLVLLAAAPAPAAELSPAEQAAILRAAAPAMVSIEYTVGYDKGEAPYGSGWATRCPNCGSYHGEDTDRNVQEERPIEVHGLLISPTRVLTTDMFIHERFVGSIAVRFGDQTVPARPAAYVKDQNAMLLDLERPLKQATPLAFDPARMGPYFTVTRTLANGAWTTTLTPLPNSITTTDAGRQFIAVPSFCLIVDKAGTAVGACMSEQLPPDDSWKKSPADWPAYSAQEMQKVLADLQKRVDAAILRVSLDFRSPKAAAPRDRFTYRHSGDEESATHRSAVGILLPENRILVLAHLKPAITARLERIEVHPAKDDPVLADFESSLSDYGCFVATLQRPLAGAISLADGDIRDNTLRLLLSAEVRIQGEKRMAYFGHRRIPGFSVGFRRQLYPEIPAARPDVFILDPAGALVALPLVQRPRISLEQSYYSESPELTAAVYLRRALENLAANSDPANIPLSEDQENRLAWMGIELQGLDRELASANNVSDLTSDGESGAIVTYVYPDSPAAVAGVEPGFVLLRLHVHGRPVPLEVKVEDRSLFESFPWEQLDQVPEEYFDQIPKPWPGVDTPFNRALTDLGFGTRYTAEFFDGQKVVRHDFAVTSSPVHFDAAPQYKAESLGLTVRDITYEVRRYMQLKDDEPGVIIEKVDQGTKASTSGIKPYELMTHVNDQPVQSVEDFRKLTDGQAELRLSIKRMAKGRQVKIMLAPPAQ